MEKHVSIIIKGKVQKVGFRFATIEQALELDIKGLVKNYQNNEVHIEAEGEVDNLKRFLRWCHIGPNGAKVEQVEYQSSEQLQNYEQFSAEY